MNEQPAAQPARINTSLILVSLLVLLAVLVLIVVLINDRAPSATQLLPALPDATAAGTRPSGPQVVTFEQLNGDPLAFLNQPIEVTGAFQPNHPDNCERRSGPQFRWSLVNDDLQLDALGFERILSLLTPGTEMVVQGTWRLYQGPLGCGKGPPVGSAWYLQAERIIQPNPLVGSGSQNGVTIEDAAPGLPGLLPTIPPAATIVATPTMAATLPPSPTAPGVIGTLETTPTATPAGSGTAVPVFTPTTAGATGVPGATPSPSGTPPTSTATPPGAGSGNPATATPQTPLPATATQTSGGGYPGPTEPTNTPDPYP